MVDVMLQVSKRLDATYGVRDQPGVVASCLAQCIRYLRCCVKNISSIFELNDLCCLGDCSIRHRST